MYITSTRTGEGMGTAGVLGTSGEDRYVGSAGIACTPIYSHRLGLDVRVTLHNWHGRCSRAIIRFLKLLHTRTIPV